MNGHWFQNVFTEGEGFTVFFKKREWDDWPDSCMKCMGLGFKLSYLFDREGNKVKVKLPCLDCEGSGWIQKGKK